MPIIFPLIYYVKYNTIPPGEPLVEVAGSVVPTPLNPALRLLPDNVTAATLP
jgi:hypothetical protein